ncbi:MAG: glycosyltransferase family 2 protein, partial [Anaerostipes sp.]|nr:glycosyltransferase family 2 protein [Anaerostipes sp.]
MEKVSIIIPVYGVEAYLAECLESLINQTYENLEIIVVDDESPDQCPKICDEFAERDKRIIVIHQKNKGAA